MQRRESDSIQGSGEPRSPAVRTVVVLALVIVCSHNFVHRLAPAEESLVGGKPASAEELLRGYTDAEYATAVREIPRRPVPPLGKPVARQVTVLGRVFEDANQNGVMDGSERGLARVLVTDGERVTRTAGDGGFEFAFAMPDEPHCRFVVATKPTGYEPTRSVFLRIPFSEPQTQYRSDFGFVADRLSKRDSFWFVTASDSQFTDPGQMIPIAKDFDQITSPPGGAAFLATAGDLTMNGTHWEWDMYDRILAASNIPVYNGFGGHDGNCLEPRSTANYELRIGPPYYSWEYGGVHFMQLISETSYLQPETRARYEKWMTADLQATAKGTPVIVIAHYPLPAEWFDLRRAEGVNILCQIAAHWHVVMSGGRAGVPVLISAPARGKDWGACSRTYRYVHVTPDGVRSELRVAGQYQRLRMFSPGPTTIEGEQPIMILAYDTARKVTSVQCRITKPGGAVITPKLIPKGDWSWHGRFAADSPGTWRFDLKASDSAGGVWEQQQSISIGQLRSTRPSALTAEPSKDFPWLLAGSPPRRVEAGPGAPLRPRWIAYTGSKHVLHSSPVVASGKVYVAVTNPNAHAPGAGVLCIDARSGQRIWHSLSPRGDIRGTVTVCRRKVYAVTAESWACAYDADTGKLLWSRPLDEQYRAGRPLAINQTPPVPTPHGLLVSDWQTPQHLLDWETGKALARLDGNVGYYSAFATVFGDVMFCARRGGALAMQLPSGRILWSKEEPSRSTSAGIVVDNKFIYASQSGVKAVGAKTGELIWEAAVANSGYQKPIPVVWDDLVLANGAAFTALDLATGKLRWSVACGQQADRFVRSRRQVLAGSSTPLAAGDIAYFGHDDTSIRAVDRDGNIVWEYCVGTPIKTAPAVSGNLLFVHDFAGNLWCFEPVKLSRTRAAKLREAADPTSP